MLRFAAVLGLLTLSGCTSVRLVQRDGCWVRRIEQWPGRITEELGPCAAPAPPWADDRVSRAVQECVARADHRWQTQAQMVWSRGRVLPDQPEREDAVYRACLEEPAKALAGENELLRRKNDELQQRLTEVAKERDATRSRVEEERARREEAEASRLAAQEKMTDRLLTSQEKVGDRLLHGQDALAAYLGEAAKKSSQPAVATATSTSRSDGTANTESASSSPSPPAQLPSALRAGGPPARPARRAAPACGAESEGARTAAACPPAAPATTPGPMPKAEVAQRAAPEEAAPTAAPAPASAEAGAGPGPEPASPTGTGGSAQEPAQK